MAVDKAARRRERRARRHARIQRKVRGTAERPRLVVSRSLRHIEGQLVDDDRGVTLVGFSSRAGGLEELLPDEMEGKVARSFAAGKRLAQKALEAGVEKVVFDRNGFLYHGRVKALADAAREAGLSF